MTDRAKGLLMNYYDILLSKDKSKRVLLEYEKSLDDLKEDKAEIESVVEGIILNIPTLKNEGQRKFKRNSLLKADNNYTKVLLRIKDVMFVIATTKIDLSKDSDLMRYYELSVTTT